MALEDLLTRQMPHSLEGEQAVLGSMLIDATCGRRTRAVIITDSDHVILSAIQTETIAGRAEPKDEDPREDIAGNV